MRRGEDILRAVVARPQEFSFVQVTRLLQEFFAPSMRYRSFLEEYVRIRPHLSLAFPPHDVVSLELLDEDDNPLPPDADVYDAARFQLTVTVLGLYGASSPLPTFYMEDLLAEERDDLRAGRDFLDLVNARFYELLLQAGWFRYRPMKAISEQGDHALTEKMLSLGGLGLACAHDLPYPPQRLTPFVGLLSIYPRSAAGLQAFLSGILGCACSVTQCVLGTVPVARDQRSRLGLGNSELGENCVLGLELQDRSGRILVELKSLSPAEMLFYTSPEGRTLVLDSISFYCTEPLEADISLSLAPETVECARLGGAPASAQDESGSGGASWSTLGQDTWLGTGECRLAGRTCVRPEGAGTAFLRGSRWKDAAR
ncbi:MAG: type VI secretion system baseplate subunit TssG [Desulfovibrionaceae bacterium]|nr:type VI secretion system baseplate subunit TssG [Desulfovibrionaceae bacterium]